VVDCVILRSPGSVLLMYLGLRLIFFHGVLRWLDFVSGPCLLLHTLFVFWRLLGQRTMSCTSAFHLWTDFWGKHRVGSSTRTLLNFTHHWGWTCYIHSISYILPNSAQCTQQPHPVCSSWIFFIGSFNKSAYPLPPLHYCVKHAS